MLVRTISQLNPQETPVANGLFEMSVPRDTAATSYISKKLTYGSLSANCTQVAENSIANTYKLKNGTTPIDVNALRATANAISSQNVTFNGIKRFNVVPFIPLSASQYPTNSSLYANNLDFAVTNVSKVNQLIAEQPMYFSTTSSMIADGNPLTHNQHIDSLFDSDSVPEQLEYATTIGKSRNKFYFWRIDANDSSKYVYDTRSGTTDGYEEMRDTGNLVVWGWLADNGDVSPEMAWVGMFSYMKYEGGDNTHVDVPISIQPWIRGQYASTLQYVGFNIPVRKGLKLKIKTGFPVNNTNSGFQNAGTMTFVDRNIPNAFFGYIVK